MEAFLQFGEWGGPYETVKADDVKENVTARMASAVVTGTASGYGKKIPTSYMIKFRGRWRRVYSASFSNLSTEYVVVDGDDVVVNLY